MIKRDISFNTYITEYIYNNDSTTEKSLLESNFKNKISNKVKEIRGFKINIESINYIIKNIHNSKINKYIPKTEVFCVLKLIETNNTYNSFYKLQAEFVNEKTLRCIFDEMNLFLNNVYELLLSFNKGLDTITTNIKIDYLKRPIIGIDNIIPVFEINPLHFYSMKTSIDLKETIPNFLINEYLVYDIHINLLDLKYFAFNSYKNFCYTFDKKFNLDVFNINYNLLGSSVTQIYNYIMKCKTNILEISEQVNKYVESNYLLKQTNSSSIISKENFYFSQLETTFNDLIYSNEESIIYSISIEILEIYPLLVIYFYI